MAGDRWHSLPMPYDRSVSGRSKRNHHVWLAGHGAVRPTHSTQNDIWVERWIRTVLSECLYLEVFDGGEQRRLALDRFIGYGNGVRPHLGIGGRTPRQRLGEKLAA